VAVETGKVSLAYSKSTRPTWAIVEAVGLADSGQAVEAVGLADSRVGLADLEQAGIGLADFKVSLADSGQTDIAPLLLIGA